MSVAIEWQASEAERPGEEWKSMRGEEKIFFYSHTKGSLNKPFPGSTKKAVWESSGEFQVFKKASCKRSRRHWIRRENRYTKKTLSCWNICTRKRRIPFSLIASSQPEDEIDSQKYYYSDENFLISAAAKHSATTLPAPQKKKVVILGIFLSSSIAIEMLVMNSWMKEHRIGYERRITREKQQ